MAGGSGDYVSSDTPEHWATAERKRVWTRGWRVLDGEETTPFARAAMVSDCTNLMTGMGIGLGRDPGALDAEAIGRVALVIEALVAACRADPEQPLPQAIKAASASVK